RQRERIENMARTKLSNRLHLTSLDEIRRREKAAKPGDAYRFIHKKLAEAAVSQLKGAPDLHGWATLDRTLRMAMADAILPFGKGAVNEALAMFGLQEKYRC
ncbi:MAG TPA: hypothetical protein VJZ94_01940, partial [Candidatus Paceibacterota bacterium]|nr:hypothetical protein [Candidatus Paceibacterota bacterium]